MPLPSKRDHAELRRRLTSWLAGRLPAGADPQVGELRIPDGTGMSSETLLFDVTWSESGVTKGGSYVARMAPDKDDFPVFPTYDLELQHRCLRLVSERCDVPVPAAPWLELDETPLGAPFLVMERVDGIVPSDMPPYVFGGWVAEATPEQRRLMQRNAMGVLARLHQIDVSGDDAVFLDRPEWGATPLEQHLAYQRWFYDWARDGAEVPIIESTFEWLEKHRPTDEGPTVLNWGDARIGNIMWKDFRPVAVLDWEMASLGAPEVDLAWMLVLHWFFHDMANRYNMPGLPDLLERESSVRDYEDQIDHKVRDLEFYEVFAAQRFAIISLRTSRRAIEYGQMEPTDDPDGLVMHRGLMQQMLDGSYWS